MVLDELGERRCKTRRSNDGWRDADVRILPLFPAAKKRRVMIAQTAPASEEGMGSNMQDNVDFCKTMCSSHSLRSHFCLSSVRVSIGEELGMEAGQAVTGKLVAALRRVRE